MKEIREIIKAYDAAIGSGKQTAMAAVVHLNGSSYRRPGARMLVDDEGNLTGAISGGCLEGDALHKAMMVLSQQQARLVTYDTTDEDDATIGVQLGCAGVIQVLFEPIDPADQNNPIQLLRKAVAIRQKAVLVTLFSLDDKRNVQAGTCLLMEENGNISGKIPFLDIEAAVLSEVKKSFTQQASFFKSFHSGQETITAFIEYLSPPVSLVIVGAGNDAIPMMQMGDILGWEVRIIDGRNTHAKPDRFKSACQVLVSKPEQALDKIPIDDKTVFVVMTHNYNYDLAMLRALLVKQVSYIGMLGPKKKLHRMLDEISASGMIISPEQMNTIYGPVGLEIGAETADEIALSVLSEVQAVMNAKHGGSLRLKKDVIHVHE